jgi:hypothetical protein
MKPDDGVLRRVCSGVWFATLNGYYIRIGMNFDHWVGEMSSPAPGQDRGKGVAIRGRTLLGVAAQVRAWIEAHPLSTADELSTLRPIPAGQVGMVRHGRHLSRPETQYAVITFPKRRSLKLVLLTNDRDKAEGVFRLGDRPNAWICLAHRPSIVATAGLQINAADLAHNENFWEAVRRAVQDHRPREGPARPNQS